jgi:ABC-type sugar transport system ATPase subunit
VKVHVQGLRFERAGRTVLDIPALEVRDGRTTALVGPNGAGKTTLLRMLAGLEKPSCGRVEIAGQAVTPAAVREQVAFAFQRPVFLSDSVRGNLDLALRLRRVGREAREARVAEVADALGITSLLGRSALQLSGGEAQRANLARALCLRAAVTLLDEPLSGLDGPARRQLLHDLPGWLRRFAATTIVVTHDRDEALRLADDMVVLINGRVRAAGPRAAVFGNPADPETAAFLGYTLIPGDGALIAVAPRGLKTGAGDFTFEMAVEEVLDFGVRREVWGTVAGERVSVRLPSCDEPPSERLVVSANTGMVRVFRPGGRPATDGHAS